MFKFLSQTLPHWPICHSSASSDAPTSSEAESGVYHPTSGPSPETLLKLAREAAWLTCVAIKRWSWKKNIEENGSQKTDFTPHFFKLCIHVLGKIFYKLLFWMGDTNKSHLFGRFICRSWCHWCHSIFHPEIDSTYVWGGLKFPPGQNVTSTTSKVWILEGSATCLISIFDGLWASPGVHGLQATNPQPLEGISVMNRMVAALLRLLTARLPLLRIVRPIISIGIRPLANDVAKDCKSM